MAVYFFKAGEGTSKKTGSPFYYVDLLRRNRFGSWELKAAFCQSDLYGQVKAKGWTPGTPVKVTVGLDAELVDIIRDDKVKPLEVVG